MAGAGPGSGARRRRSTRSSRRPRSESAACSTRCSSPTRPRSTLFRADYFPQLRYDPITLLAAIGMVSRQIGLIGTATTTYNEPYELARRLATADHVTGGRIGWNVVTTHNAEASLNFGRDPHPEHDDRYARAAEFVEVTRRLWDSWPEDAIVGDRATGRWADSTRFTPADFHGRVLRRRRGAAGAAAAAGPSGARPGRIVAGRDRARRRGRRPRVHAAARRRGGDRVPGEDRRRGRRATAAPRAASGSSPGSRTCSAAPRPRQRSGGARSRRAPTRSCAGATWRTTPASTRS